MKPIQPLGFSPKRSSALMVEPGGSFGIPVSDAPNGTFNFALAFTAQPLASRIGPRLRLRSFSHAMIIDGPEITNSSPTTARQSCQNGSLNKPVVWPINVVIKAPIAPKATPNAATVPTSIFFGSPALALSALAVDVAAEVNRESDAASAAAARLATCSSIKRTSFL